VIVNTLPRYEILSEEEVAVLDAGWRRIVSELGVAFSSDEAVAAFRGAGQLVDDERVVKLDPDFLLEQVAKAPREFDLQARNPDRSVHIGGDTMVFSPVYGSPFVREGPTRREATLDDYRNFARLSQSLPQLDSVGGTLCEPNDVPLDSRHLDMVYTLLTESDKPFMGSVTSGPNAADTIAMAELVFGRESIERTPCVISIVNVNSPLLYDDRMLAALFEYARANQPLIVTPFLLMGAMSPVSIPSALAQNMAEALAGIALTQLIRPGCPVVLGSFLSNTDMQSGSPSFGTPESAVGLLCTGQIARHLRLPWRSGGGGLTSSQTVDAQGAYEAVMTMFPAMLAGANYVMHAAGWLESGLVSSYEKFDVDIEVLRRLEAMFGEEPYQPLQSSWRQVLDEYEEPPIEPDLRDELRAYVDRRRRELGD
jgi:trimethylamine--corrinoid protein Co-methyltransferase